MLDAFHAGPKARMERQNHDERERVDQHREQDRPDRGCTLAGLAVQHQEQEQPAQGDRQQEITGRCLEATGTPREADRERQRGDQQESVGAQPGDQQDQDGDRDQRQSEAQRAGGQKAGRQGCCSCRQRQDEADPGSPAQADRQHGHRVYSASSRSTCRSMVKQRRCTSRSACP